MIYLLNIAGFIFIGIFSTITLIGWLRAERKLEEYEKENGNGKFSKKDN